MLFLCLLNKISLFCTQINNKPRSSFMFYLKTFFKHSRLVFLSFLIVPFLFSCEPDPEPGPTLYDSIATLPNSSTFLEALDIAEFDDDFRTGQFLTIFVPTNDAFDTFLSQNNYASLNEIPLDDLRQILRYHILSYGVAMEGLPTSFYLTASGAGFVENFLAIFINNEGTSTSLNDDVEVLTADLSVDGSYYNVISEVLALPTNLSVIRQTEAFQQFSSGINEFPALVDSLGGKGPFTVLVSPDQFVEPAIDDRYGVDSLINVESTSLDSLMRTHIIKGNHRSQDMLNSANFSYETLLQDKPIDIRGVSRLIVNTRVNITLADIQTTNGVVHLLDGLLEIPE